ncbi:glycoside hydrolase family 3 C-terminal domain-containing protein [Enterovibrio sp. ZSDZ42]|uniref:Glycoside hydrolase family 3 C-terminal domain-containing protein n=1 Tax=Enterovibrio gelatinilyticus TaxID=2899819 RepID=A0ABT5R596_9GAMM|nr:glycoside hydrolase family 3 protein [Enterovibrio sp. ZSDZ42]MDD1795164.1 glycoside hydrolase family 3 C-terminal domain-containing protein [Enterovibrio sp. ZSDZ42]
MNKQEINDAQRNLVSVSRQAAAEGVVLLKNTDSVLPLKEKDVVSLFGRCQIDTYRSGTGSGGAVNVPYAISVLEGFRANSAMTINEDLVAVYQDWIADHPFDDGGGAWAAEPWFQQEMPLSDELVASASACSNKAMVFIGRTAGEDQDNADEQGSYRLTDCEIDMITKVAHHFSNVIVVMNVSNIMDMSWLNTLEDKQSLKAVLYSWAAGMEGGHALADIVSGQQSPSGRLTDTIAHQLSDYPSSANFGRKDRNLYVEDIYVGYRYFETFQPDSVQFEFGAGLSYTAFTRELVDFSIQGEGAKALLSFDIKVSNIGSDYASKEVVQLYVEAPQGQLGKPAKVLIGFAKTKVIEPSDSDSVRISVPASMLASYDDSGATGYRNSYVLESGTYRFFLGDSIRHANHIAADYHVNALVVVESLSEACAPVDSFDRIKPADKKPSGIYETHLDTVPVRTISLAERIHENMPKPLEIVGDKGIKLIDVKQGKASLSEFVAQMSPEQLAMIVRGEGMCSPKVTPGTASAFGGLSDCLFNLGIPVASAADGPSGIRMDSGHKATQVPIGTLLGCTWNVELNETLFHLIGKELRANQIDTLLGPGINIHRHPLNGRNFEYFSEDPLITGVMAAAQTRGLADAGVSGTIKHFAGNDQETARVDVDSVMSERALREIHIKPFEIAVKEGKASTIMTSYNPVNGHWAASNYDLNTTILRNEWGFTGIVMTDWWAKMNDPINAGQESKTFTSFMIRAQNDLYMVVEHNGAESNIMGDDTLEALANNTLTLGELQRSAMNICRFIMSTPVMERPLKAYEPIKSFAALDQAPEGSIHRAEQTLSLHTNVNKSVTLEVNEPASYQFQGVMHFDRDSLAQSACSLFLNGEFGMTLPTNGTDGERVTVEGLQVKLQPGFYVLDIDFVKPGLVLEEITISKV